MAFKYRRKKKRNTMGVLVPYISRRRRDDPIRVWFFEHRRMSEDGYRRWAKKFRPHLNKTVYCPVGSPVFVDPSQICNKDRLGQTAVDIIQYPGTFMLRMPTRAKNTYRVSYKKKATIRIDETEEGLRGRVVWVGYLSRYWFWEKA